MDFGTSVSSHFMGHFIKVSAATFKVSPLKTRVVTQGLKTDSANACS